eukprot:1159892-Pelagomonas_calceolata.AAC.24
MRNENEGQGTHPSDKPQDRPHHMKVTGEGGVGPQQLRGEPPTHARLARSMSNERRVEDVLSLLDRLAAANTPDEFTSSLLDAQPWLRKACRCRQVYSMD